MNGTLFLIPNTLGHSKENNPLAYIIPEEVQILTADLDYFIAENAKTTRAFLKTLSTTHPLKKPIQEIKIAELNVNTKEENLPKLLEPILNGMDAGLISEAGVPAVADPGANLVRLAHKKNIPVKPLIGPSSILLSLMASGLHGQSFAFNGYLPTETSSRTKKIKTLEERSKREQQTQIFIETPYRNTNLLEALINTCRENTLISVACNLTAPDEWICTQTARKWKEDFTQRKIPDIHRKPTVFLFLAV